MIRGALDKPQNTRKENPRSGDILVPAPVWPSAWFRTVRDSQHECQLTKRIWTAPAGRIGDGALVISYHPFRRKPRVAKRGFCIALKCLRFKISLSLTMKSKYTHKIGLYFCFIASAICAGAKSIISFCKHLGSTGAGWLNYGT